MGDADDESGNGNHGSVHGDALLTTDRFSNSNSAYIFDGDEDYITVPTSSSLDNISQGPITMCCWAKPDVFDGGIVLQFNTVDFNGGGYQ